jgi:hypothetical protein
MNSLFRSLFIILLLGWNVSFAEEIKFPDNAARMGLLQLRRSNDALGAVLISRGAEMEDLKKMKNPEKPEGEGFWKLQNQKLNELTKKMDMKNSDLSTDEQFISKFSKIHKQGDEGYAPFPDYGARLTLVRNMRRVQQLENALGMGLTDWYDFDVVQPPPVMTLFPDNELRIAINRETERVDSLYLGLSGIQRDLKILSLTFKAGETQPPETERKAAKLDEEERVRLAKEQREWFEANRLQREQAQIRQREQEEKLKLAEIQRIETERKAAKLDEEERVRLAKEREQLEAAKVQREQEQQREQAEKLKLAQQEALAVQSGKRIALVIGNSKYIRAPLKNPANDADDMSYALKAANFQVIDIREATLPQMRNAVRQFGDKLLQNDIGLVYYSGHGVEVKGKNYLIPVNADIQRPDEIVDQSLDMALILEKMTTAGKGVNILIVDACRVDPMGKGFRSPSQGLATVEAPTGTIIAYATSPGKVADDGEGRNSPYTKALVKAMQTPNKPIEQVFKEVRRSVLSETSGRQTPWENTSLSGDFYFRVQK